MTQPPDLDRQAVRRQFDRRAHRFEQADYLLREIEDRLFDRLQWIRLEPARVLDVGCGLGAGLRRLQQRFGVAQAVGVDLSSRMLSRAATHGVGQSGSGAESHSPGSRLSPRGWSRRLRQWLPGVWPDSASPSPKSADDPNPALFVAGDAHRLPLADASVDLLWSNLVFHWLDDPLAAIAEWHRVLRPGGLVMFSALGVDTLAELKALGLPVAALADMHDVGDALGQAGFSEPVMDTERLTVTWSDVERLFGDLRALGGNPMRGRPRALAGRGNPAELRRRISQALGAHGSLGVTFEVIYGHAWCPSPKRRSDGYAPIEFRPRRLAAPKTAGL